MYPSTGLQTALNAMREASVKEGSIYHQYVPYVTESTTIGEFGAPILDSQNINVLNDFVGLLKKVVYTAVYNKTFNNPLAQLEGERMPLGNFIEAAYVNPASPEKFNVNDFLGLLQKYEAQVAVEYYSITSDAQFSVTLTRDKIRNAFTSWSNLEELISGYINSLYNGCYILRYNQTKGLPVAAFNSGAIKYEVINDVTDEATAKNLIRKIRADFSKMQIPSTHYNAWQDVKGEDAFALQTWSDPEDLILLISADVEAMVDVEVLAAAFNLDKDSFLARKITVDSFDQYDKDGNKVLDGSMIKAALVDRSWFKIKTQDFAMDEFFNARNRTWNYFLNDTRMVNYSLFANAKIYTTAEPTPSGSDSE